MDVEQFVDEGFTVLRSAVGADLVASVNDLVWSILRGEGVMPSDPATWTRPVVRLPCPNTPELLAAATCPGMCDAYDELIGVGRWDWPERTGHSIPVRFPSEECPSDVGWHIDGNWKAGAEYATNVRSAGRGLTVLCLFTDVGSQDAPMGIIPGSHLHVAALLAAHGEKGLGGNTVAAALPSSILSRRVEYATGQAGDVYLCHPFLLHTATWPHRGSQARVAAALKIVAGDGFVLDGTDASPIARSIAIGAGQRQLR